MVNSQTKPLLHGVVLVAGGAIGAGMFALPIVSVGAGFGWSVLGLILVWFLTYQASVMLLRANVKFAIGASFNTVVAGLLGRRWAQVNNLAIVFVMTILMYAYSTAGASILEYSLSSLSPEFDLPTRGWLSLIASAIVAGLVCSGSVTVSRASIIFLLTMTFSFILVVGNLLPLVKPAYLLEAPQALTFIGAALPVFVATLACGGLVPSLVKHYQADFVKIQRCLFFGSLLSLVIYIIWLAVTLGVIDRVIFRQVIAAGGNTGDLVAGLVSSGANETLNTLLNTFSHLAIITSFLSIGLGMFDFILDRFNLPSNLSGRSIAGALVFLPPALMSFFFPYGFVSAITYAGLAVLFSFFIVPAMLHRRLAVLSAKPRGRRWASSISFLVILVFALLIMAFKLLSVFNGVPVYS